MVGVTKQPRTMSLNSRMVASTESIHQRASAKLASSRAQTLLSACNKTPSYGSRIRQAGTSLRRKVHAPQQVLESRIGAQVVEAGISLQAHHMHGVSLVTVLQPMEGFLFAAQGCMNVSHTVRTHVALLCDVLQLVQDLLSLLTISACGIRLPKRCEEERCLS